MVLPYIKAPAELIEGIGLFAIVFGIAVAAMSLYYYKIKSK
jgi:hypothetical protein